MIRPLLAFVALLLPAAPAGALTCAPADPLQSFRSAHAAPESYVVLHGRLSFDPAVMSGSREPPPGALETVLEPVEARFEGAALGLVGFTRPVRASVHLVPTCLGQFCGSIGPGEDWLLFARPSGTGTYRVEIDPCGAWAFDRPSQGTLDALAACFREGACEAP